MITKKLKQILILLTAIVLLSPGCMQADCNRQNGSEIWNNSPNQVITMEQVNREINQKVEMLQRFMNKHNLGGMMFTQVRNFYWITAGKMNNQIVLNKDVGAASALIMKDGRRLLISTSAEAYRLMDEGMRELGFEWVPYNWYEANELKDVRGELMKQLAGNEIIGSDIDYPGTLNVDALFRPLRYSLLPTEIERYRWVCSHTTLAVEDVCRNIEPGMTEFELEAITAAELWKYGILPTVFLTAVDERIRNYRHAVPGGAVLKQYAMINVVAEKWGMPVAITRFVHFGELPPELKDKFERTAIVNARYQIATRPGVVMADIFEQCKQWYAEVGYEGEWKKHHQGGAIGYDDREYVIWPGNPNVVQVNQPFAWNPTITGSKVEDTILVQEDGFEVLTASGNWPVIDVIIDDKNYPQPGVLIR